MAINPLLAEHPSYKKLLALQRRLHNPLAGREVYPIQPYQDEEEESVLKKALGVPLSALGYIGGALDKPRRALWGTIGGRPRELGNLIPFSDALGITNEHDAIGGREALEKAGILGPNQEGLDWGDVIGFGAEVLGDPLTYVGGLGALGKVGKVAKKAGAMGDVLSIAAKKAGHKVGRLHAGQLVTHADLMAHAASNPKKLKALQDATGGAQQLADLAKLNEPISGLTTLGVPGFGPGKVVGTGARAQKVARGLDKASDFVRYSKPGREAARLFSKPVKQTAEAASQPRAAEGFHVGEAAKAEASMDYATKWQKLAKVTHDDDWGTVSDILRHAGEGSLERDVLGAGRQHVKAAMEFLAANPTAPRKLPGAMTSTLKEAGFVFDKNLPGSRAQQAHDYLTKWVANAPAAPTRDTVENIVQSRLGTPGALPSGSIPHPELEKLLTEIAKDARSQFDEVSSATRAMGAGRVLDDRSSLYLKRSLAAAQARTGQGAKSFANTDASDLAREDMFRHIPKTKYGPGGTSTIDRWAADPNISGPSAALNHADAAKYIRENGLGLTANDTHEMHALAAAKKANQIAAGSMDDWRLRSLQESHAQADSIAEFLRKSIPDERVSKGMPQYRDAMADFLTGIVSQRQKLASINSTHDLIADVAAQGVKGVPLKVAFKKAKLRGIEAYKTFAQRMIDRGKPLQNVMQALNGTAKQQKLAKRALDTFIVPEGHAKDIERIMDFYNEPDTLKWGLNIYDKLTNWIKSHLTVVAPSFFARNAQTMFWSDMLVNVQNATNPAEWGNLFENWKMQYALLKGQTVKGLSKFKQFAGMTDEESTRMLRSAQFGHRVASAKIGVVSDMLGPHGQDLSHFSRDIPGVTPTSPAMEAKRVVEDAKHHGKSALNPFNTRGGHNPVAKSWNPLKGGQEVPRDQFSPWLLANAGERANGYMESLGRGATFIGQLRHGASFDTASELSRLAHVDYGTLTRFEKEYIQRIFPFWAWAKGSIPFTLKQLWDRPGGPTAKSIMASKRATEDEPFTPEQLRGSSSIPIGEGRSPGLKRYMTIDLPHETLNDWASFRPTALGTIKATGMGIASQLNPMLKAPAELVTGQSFFQKGRPLTDLYSPTGNVLLDQALTNTPASRYLSTFNQLAQPSSRKTISDKAANTLLGLRIQDVDIPKAKSAATREYAQELLRGSPGVKSFQDLYVPKDQLDQLSPQQVELLRLLKTQSARATQKKKDASKPEREAQKRRKQLLLK